MADHSSLSVILRMVPLLLILCNCVTLDAQQFFLKQCPKQRVVKRFDANRYLGLWYENRKYFAIFQAGGRCVTAKYTNEGTNLIGVENAMINIFNKPQSVKGQAKLADPSSTEGKLSVSFSSETPYADSADTVTDGNYQVLDTDYDTYAVVWSCTGITWFFNTQFMWILTRERDPPSSVMDKALEVVNSRGLDASRFMITDQTDC